MSTPAATFDSRELRQALGAFVTGVTVVTTIDAAGKPHGLTANSFSSVSLNPPLILWSQSLSAGSHPVFRDAERFVVNILAEDQVDISNRFANAAPDKFDGVPVRLSAHGLPLIDGCCGYLECRRISCYPGGDHAVFLGEVERIDFNSRKPLVFGGGKYLVAQPHDLGAFSADIELANVAHLKAVRLATAQLARLANELEQTLALAVWGNHGPTVIRWEESARPVSLNLRTGLVLPVSGSATGHVFAAYLPETLTAPFVTEELREGAGAGVVGPRTQAEFETIMAEVRAQGLARVIGTGAFSDMYGGAVNAISAPVFDAEGTIALSLTAVGRANTLDVEWDAPVPTALKRAAVALSRRLGFAGRL